MRNFNEFINYIYNRNRINLSKCDSVSLAFSKLLKKEIIENTKLKSDFLQGINRVTIILNLKQRIQQQILSLKNQGYINLFENGQEKCLKLKTSSRLVVGLGAGHVLETSLTLHHIFGIPYIPGSALKGVVRMVSFWEIAKNRIEEITDQKQSEKIIEDLQGTLYDSEITNDDKDEILKHKLLFGTQGFKGLLLFLDAFPITEDNPDIFDLDIMNVHYPSYYGSEGAPGDWENPRPIVFLTVRKGIEFCFCVLFDRYRADELMNSGNDNIKKMVNDWLNNPDGLKSNVQGWIDCALKEFGVGAKTRLGYGIFE